MANDFGGLDELLSSLAVNDVVLSQTHFNTAGKSLKTEHGDQHSKEGKFDQFRLFVMRARAASIDLRLVAVSSGHNPVLVDQGATAEVVA